MSFVLPIKKSASTEPVNEDKGKQKYALDDGSSASSKIPELQYEEPTWSGLPKNNWYLEVLKGGTILDTVHFPRDKSFLTCGRLPICDLSMEHSSVSRLHAILQFNRDGSLYIFDLNSSHGTFLNKHRISPGTHIALTDGSLIRFGESTRLYVLHTDKVEEENDAVKESTIDGNFGNPIQSLRQWFHEHGSRLTFTKAKGPLEDENVVLQIVVPADFASVDHDIIIQGSGKSRKEAEHSVCKNVCDKLLELDAIAPEAIETRDWEEWKRIKLEDEEDELDVYYDRTSKKPRSNTSESEAETFQSLTQRRLVLLQRIRTLEEKAEDHGDALEGGDLEGDDLDTYMASISSRLYKETVESTQSDLLSARSELEKIEAILDAVSPP